MITVAANPAVARVHDHMPAILAPDAESEWLDPKTSPARAQELLLPYPSAFLSVRRVSPRVGAIEIDEPSLLEPAANAQGDLFGF